MGAAKVFRVQLLLRPIGLTEPTPPMASVPEWKNRFEMKGVSGTKFLTAIEHVMAKEKGNTEKNCKAKVGGEIKEMKVEKRGPASHTRKKNPLH